MEEKKVKKKAGRRVRGPDDGYTAKKDKLCRVYIEKGTTWIAAYREAFGSEREGERTAMANAVALKKDPWVIARLAELREQAQQKTLWNLERLIEQFMDDRDFAREHGHASAAVQATMHIGKALGLYVDQREVRVVSEFDTMSKQQLIQFIAENSARLPEEERRLLIEHNPDEFQEEDEGGEE